MAVIASFPGPAQLFVAYNFFPRVGEPGNKAMAVMLHLLVNLLTCLHISCYEHCSQNFRGTFISASFRNSSVTIVIGPMDMTHGGGGGGGGDAP